MSAASIPSPSASIPPAEDKFSQADIAKVAIDYAKHVSTLASGSIVVVATFFEKFADLKFRTLVGWAMGLLASSILLSCVSMLALILHGARPELRPIKLVAYMQTVLLSLSVMLFFTGIFALSLFIMLNVAFGR
jgi:hypothetical protein